MQIEDIVKLWDDQADEYNKWDSLDADERVQFAIKCMGLDTTRLDWLADKNNLIGNVQLPTSCVMAHLDDLRAAIDMAMIS